MQRVFSRMYDRPTLRTLVVVACAFLLSTPVLFAQEKTRLHYFTWAGGSAAEYIREDFIEPFEALHPDIEIYYEAVSFSQFFDKLVTYYLAGTPPDLMHMSVGYVNEYAKNGMLLNLQPYFDRDLNPDDFSWSQ